MAQYSRPAFEQEAYSEDEQLELYDSAPQLSLKFALPPIAQVYQSAYPIPTTASDD